MTGFPQGLRPSDWMGDLVSKKLDNDRAENIRVTDFLYPGSHDSATYGRGLEDFSYECQDKTLYDQMMIGQRAFDIRLAVDKDDIHKFIPVHGIAKHTADDFSQNPKEAKDSDLASQIMKFANDHPKEILVLKIMVDGIDTDQNRRIWANTLWNLLGPRLVKAPVHGNPPPRYSRVIGNGRNIILGTDPGSCKFEGDPHPVLEYVWAVGKNTDHWMGDGNEQLWNEPDWQSGELPRVLNSTETWIQGNKDRCAPRDRFWVAYLQLTPVLGQNFTTFIKSGGSIRPKDLALGGGLGTHGQFKGSNKELRECGVLKKHLWRNHASCLMYDFADEHTAGAIVAMNLPLEG